MKPGDASSAGDVTSSTDQSASSGELLAAKGREEKKLHCELWGGEDKDSGSAVSGGEEETTAEMFSILQGGGIVRECVCGHVSVKDFSDNGLADRVILAFIRVTIGLECSSLNPHMEGGD
ncbi:hypothetical protein EYF80_056287 [Liparis tanakae]|uniref:Uncharacterized protein n=1 Tax=Liparis tanakae TaxID=230148 RepID=A0A4Z2EYW2_9TELE|nr:hypothetical protein EYF80_056287 [Liparis tanakae]